MCAINPIRGMTINIETRKPEQANLSGGLSGPAIKPIALRMVWEICEAVRIPVIGVGGISSGSDAIEFLLDKLKSTKQNSDFFDAMNT